ncbi:hypothetical protein [Qipengyuania atrilutea]|uniref:Uncharacterized protein n=1 Tax=Qipengyuania atrilutea TaxID=2744473 RepID=A0A850HEB2_9SPHN|nr:hypothetical protein [Actirhodobacter atriluteus]NVD45549.1 hypothetical protein [Actirhodobacter atriluteus]
MDEPAPHDAHVQAATKLFRDCGFTLHAMQFPRSPEALVGLKRFNGLADDAKVPFAWGYHPNAYMRDNWQRYYGEAERKVA